MIVVTLSMFVKRIRLNYHFFHGSYLFDITYAYLSEGACCMLYFADNRTHNLHNYFKIHACPFFHRRLLDVPHPDQLLISAAISQNVTNKFSWYVLTLRIYILDHPQTLLVL